MKQLLKKTSFLICVVSLIIMGCQNPGNESQNDQQGSPPLKAKDISFSRQSGKCSEDSNRCARISAVYPQLIEGPEAIITKINDTVSHYLSASLAVFSIEENEIITNLDTIAMRFIQDYEELIAESPDYNMAWEVSTKGKVLYQNEHVLSVELNNYSFTGGAHPNSYLSYLNFDVKKGKKLDSKDWILAPDLLTKKAEEKFREAMNLGPDDNLNEAGYFFGNSFSLPENIGFNAEGLELYYNPYEAAAYAVGPISFVLKYTDLENIISTKYISE